MSSRDITIELGPLAREIYQSSRNGYRDLPSVSLPPNVIRVSEVESLNVSENRDLSENETLPIIFNLKSGQTLCDIHFIILATGYHFTLPFLLDYHDDNLSPSGANETVLVTDGSQMHNLHKDIFYIPDPSLTFVGVPSLNITFSLFDYQALAVAAVLSGNALLPDMDEMRHEYNVKVAEKGAGKRFHELLVKEIDYVKNLVDWINRDRAIHGRPPVEGHMPEWLEAHKGLMRGFKALFEAKKKEAGEIIVARLPRVC